MARELNQFDVCLIKAKGAGSNRLVVVLQHRVLSDLATVVVAPLYRIEDLPAISQLRPVVRIGNQDYVMAVDRMASLPVAQLGPSSKNLIDMDYQIRKALDLVFSGF